MWTSTLDLSPSRVILTNLLGRFWRGAYFSSFAPLRVQNVPRQPLPSPNWVRVRNRLAGICGSDLHLLSADGDLRVAPAALPGHDHIYLGHEAVGDVIEIGDDVHQLQVGDRVVLQHDINCLSSSVQPLCRSCASGNYGLCERGTFPGPHPIGGGWSEEMLLHEQQLFPVPSAMTDAQAVLLEPSAVAVHTVLRRIPQAGDRVLIIGAGTIGLLTLQVVRSLASQAEISVLARYPFQVEKATRMGAAHIIYPQDSYSGVQQATQAQLYKGMLGNQMLLGGYDVIYDTIGNQDTIHNALRWARAKATVVLVGLNLHMMHIDLTPVWYQEINLIGTLGQGMEVWPIGTQEQRSTFSVTADLIMNGLLHPEQLITHHFALNNYRQALMTALAKRDQRAIKVVFDYSLLPASVVPNVRASAPQRRPAVVDLIKASPLITKNLAQKEVAQPAVNVPATQPVTPVLPTSTKQPLPLVPLVSWTKPEQVEQNQAVPSSLPTSIVEREQATTPTEEMPIVEAKATPEMRPPTEIREKSQLEPVETRETLPVVEGQSIQVAPAVAVEQIFSSVVPFDEASLDEFEWLDIIAAENEGTQQEVALAENEGTVQERSFPTVPAALSDKQHPSVVEESSFYTFVAPDNNTDMSVLEEYQDEEPREESVAETFENIDQDHQEYPGDMSSDTTQQEEPYHDTQEEHTPNIARETLLTTKTTKAINPGKLRSKLKHKGKNTTGIFRS